MDCCLCNPTFLRLPRHIICSSCLQSARSILELSSLIQQQKIPHDEKDNQSQGLLHAFNQMEYLKITKQDANEKLEFLQTLWESFKEGFHTDIELISNDGHSFHAHSVVLGTKSSVLKVMFEADVCKSKHTGPIVIDELNRNQLHNMLEFLYTANLTEADMCKNASALLMAAHKYDIPVLARVCETHLAKNVSVENALNMLELASTCTSNILRESSIKLIIDKHQFIVFSKEYEHFALRNAFVAVEITRALVQDLSK